MAAMYQTTRSKRAPLALLGVSLVFAPLLSGCGSNTDIDLRREISRLQEELKKKDGDLAAQFSTISELNKQLLAARSIKPEDLDKLFYPEKLTFDSLTGGENYDGKPGDDGVTVYIRPIDRDGDVVKVAGDIRIELFDLSRATDNLIGRYDIPLDAARKLWYGKIGTYHYTVKCPWLHGPPPGDEITIRATFRDFLTQRVLTAQTVVTVKLPPTTQPK
ncbi:MAG: hypothetical protein HZB38_12310 [Planctomycetes bacterium]|nr:hypothetical protein [Planctomycetota bacterium]